jgi:hypothetical protein
MESWNASLSEESDIHRGTFLASGRVNIARKLGQGFLMLTDRYGLSLSTASAGARDAYVEGCDLVRFPAG